ncbi:MAG: alpha-1,2-fucosyltransferase [Saprospiraceae bacterium]
MIITRIKGGLGNQLFQYAAARSLAIKNNTILKLEVVEEPAAIHQMNIEAEIATTKEITELYPQSFFIKIFNHLQINPSKKYFKEKSFHFDSSFFNLGANVYLNGYFQSEKYFYTIKDLILNELTPRHSLIQNVMPLSMKLVNENSVSIHIRRGDYLANKAILSYHGILPLEYYIQAFKIIISKIPNPSFYIFTDDNKWVKENFKFTQATIVSNNLSQTSIEDIFLMSKCKYHIIANSSFSWWAAWLNNNPDKIVIAPNKWFNNGPKDTFDLIPQSWIKI